MPSKSETILNALADRLRGIPGTRAERNTAVPERIPAGGLIVLRDGDPGEPERVLGGFRPAYYSHAVEIEVYVEEGDPSVRDTAFDALVQAIGGVLDEDPTLGGLAFGMTYGRPEIDTEVIEGGAAIKTGTITVTVEYESPSALG